MEDILLPILYQMLYIEVGFILDFWQMHFSRLSNKAFNSEMSKFMIRTVSDLRLPKIQEINKNFVGLF